MADETAFYNFITVVAASTAKPIVYAEIANEVGICAPAAKKWLSIPVSSRIIAIVQPYVNSTLKRIPKMPPTHFPDTGLRASLLIWGNPEALVKGAMSGAFLESHVFSEICNVIGAHASMRNRVFANAIPASLPIVIGCLSMQKIFMQGLTSGAAKG